MSRSTANSSAVSPSDSSFSHSVIAQFLPIAVLVVFVNGMVFLLFAKDKRLRTPTNYLLFSLAVCDFMTGLINIPLTIILLMKAISPPRGFILGFFLVVLHNLVAILVVYHILAITAERYFSIVHPFRHRWQMTKKSSLKIVGVIWLVAIIIAFLPVTWFQRFLNFQDDSITVTLQIQTGHIIFCIIFVLLLPYVFIIYSQVVMFRKIRQGCLQFGAGEGRRDSAVNQKAKDMKRCLTIFALMAFFYAICWLPWFVISLFHSLWFPLSEEAKTILLTFSHIILIVRYLTSIINPVLYTFLKKDFLEAFRTIILRRKIRGQHKNSQAQIVGLGLSRKRESGARSLLTVEEEEEDIEHVTVV